MVLNPDTEIHTIFPYLNVADYILLMSVFPGYGGQTFIKSTLEKVAQLKNKIKMEGTDCLIQVDGGINTSNLPLLKKTGADLFVIGTFLYNSHKMEETLKRIRNKINGV